MGAGIVAGNGHAMTRGQIAGLVALVCVAGCASYSTRLGAGTLAPGDRRAGVALDGIVFERGREYLALPVPELFMRWGMGPRWDLGFTANVGGAEALARWKLFHRGGIGLALSPALGAGLALATNKATDVLRARASIRVLTEARLTDRVMLLAGLKPDWVVVAPATLLRGVTETTRLLFEPGMALGARICIDGKRALWPEINVHVPWTIGGDMEPLIVQGGVALTW
jgi:hypothetical protein